MSFKIGQKHSISTREKISVANKGRKFSAIHRENLSKSHIGPKNHLWGKHRTEDERKRMSEKQKGSNAHNWQGGLTEQNFKLRNSLEYRLWRESVFKRDNYTCRFCGKTGVELNADHIKPFAHYPELRFAIDNGRTLCIPCHKQTFSYGRKLN